MKTDQFLAQIECLSRSYLQVTAMETLRILPLHRNLMIQILLNKPLHRRQKNLHQSQTHCSMSLTPLRSKAFKNGCERIERVQR